MLLQCSLRSDSKLIRVSISLLLSSNTMDVFPSCFSICSPYFSSNSKRTYITSAKEDISISEMGKIYGKVNAKPKESKKKKNEHNRRRNVIKNFRISPKERDLIEARAAVTGMNQSSYFIQSCLYQKILIKGNIRSFSALRAAIKELTEKIDKNPHLEDLEPADAERLLTILQIIENINERG